MGSVIERESYIVGIDKLIDVYEGHDEISSHIILVPANFLRPEKLPEQGGKNKDPREITINSFGYSKDFEKYESQLRKEFKGNVPLSIISKNYARVFDENDFFDDGNDALRAIAKEWPFDISLGNGKTFLQIAYVNKMRGIKRLENQIISDFLNNNPLISLRGSRDYVYGIKERNIISPDELKGSLWV